MKNVLGVLGAQKENVDGQQDKKLAVTKTKQLANSKGWNTSTRVSPLYRKRGVGAGANKENAGKTVSQGSAGSKPVLRKAAGTRTNASASLRASSSGLQSQVSVGTLDQASQNSSCTNSSQDGLSQQEAMSPLKPVHDFQFPQAPQMVGLQAEMLPSAPWLRPHAEGSQSAPVLQAQPRTPGTPMTPAAPATGPMLSPGIKLTPPECKAMIDAVEMAINDLEAARTPGGVDLQDTFPAWLDRAGIPQDMGSAARLQLKVLYDRAREGAQLRTVLEQFKSSELEMAQTESAENERFISFLADENADLQTTKSMLVQDNEQLRQQLEAMREQLQALQQEQVTDAPIALLRDPEVYITDRHGPMAPSPGLQRSLTPSIEHATAWASEPAIPADGLLMSPVLTPSLHEAVAWVIDNNVAPVIKGGSTPVSVPGNKQAAATPGITQPTSTALDASPVSAPIASSPEVPAGSEGSRWSLSLLSSSPVRMPFADWAGAGADDVTTTGITQPTVVNPLYEHTTLVGTPISAPSAPTPEAPAGSEGSRFSLSMLSSTPVRVPFAEWAAAGAVSTGDSADCVTPSMNSTLTAQYPLSPAQNPTVSMGGMSALTTPGDAGFMYRQTPGSTPCSPCSRLTTPGADSSVGIQAPASLVASKGIERQPIRIGSPSVSLNISAGPQCSGLSMLSSSPEAARFTEWAAQFTHGSPSAPVESPAAALVHSPPGYEAGSLCDPSSPTPVSELCSDLGVLTSTPAAVPFGEWAAATSARNMQPDAGVAGGALPHSPALSFASTLSPAPSSGGVYAAGYGPDGTPISGGMLLNAVAINATPEPAYLPRPCFGQGMDQQDVSPLPLHIQHWGLQGSATPTFMAASPAPSDSDFTFGGIGQPPTPGITSRAQMDPAAVPSDGTPAASPFPGASPFPEASPFPAGPGFAAVSPFHSVSPVRAWSPFTEAAAFPAASPFPAAIPCAADSTFPAGSPFPAASPFPGAASPFPAASPLAAGSAFTDESPYPAASPFPAGSLAPAEPLSPAACTPAAAAAIPDAAHLQHVSKDKPMTGSLTSAAQDIATSAAGSSPPSPTVTMGSVAPTPAGAGPGAWQHAHLVGDASDADGSSAEDLFTSPDPEGAFATPLDAFGVQATPGSDGAFFTGRSVMPTTGMSMPRTGFPVRAAPSVIKGTGAGLLFGTPLPAGPAALAAVPEASEGPHGASDPADSQEDRTLCGVEAGICAAAMVEAPASPSSSVQPGPVEAVEVDGGTPAAASPVRRLGSPAGSIGAASSCASCGPASPVACADAGKVVVFPGFHSPAEAVAPGTWLADESSSPDAVAWPVDCASVLRVHHPHASPAALESLAGSTPVADYQDHGLKVSAMVYDHPESIFARVARSPSDMAAAGTAHAGHLAYDLGLEASQSASLMAQSVSDSNGSVCSRAQRQQRPARLPQPAMLDTPCAHPEGSVADASPAVGAHCISAASAVVGAAEAETNQRWAGVVIPALPCSPCASPGHSATPLQLESVCDSAVLQTFEEVQPFDDLQSDSALSTPPRQRTSRGMVWVQASHTAEAAAGALLGVPLPDGSSLQVDASPLSAKRSVQALCSPASTAARSTRAGACQASPGASGVSSSMFGSMQSSDVCELLYGATGNSALAGGPTSHSSRGSGVSHGAVGAVGQHHVPTPVNSPGGSACDSQPGCSSPLLAASYSNGTGSRQQQEGDPGDFGEWVGAEEGAASEGLQLAAIMHASLYTETPPSQLHALGSPSPTPFSSPAVSVKSASGGLPAAGVAGLLGGLAKPQTPSIRPSPTPCSSPAQSGPLVGSWRASEGTPAASMGSAALSHDSVSSSVTKPVPSPASLQLDLPGLDEEVQSAASSTAHVPEEGPAADDALPLGDSNGGWGSMLETPNSQLAQLFVLLQEEPTPHSGRPACTPLNTPLGVKPGACNEASEQHAADGVAEVEAAVPEASVLSLLCTGTEPVAEAAQQQAAAEVDSPCSSKPDAGHERDQDSSGSSVATTPPAKLQQRTVAAAETDVHPVPTSAAASPMPSIYAGICTPMTDSLYDGITTPQSTLSALMPRPGTQDGQGAAGGASTHAISQLLDAVAGPIAASPSSSTKAVRGLHSKPLPFMFTKAGGTACPASPATRGSSGSHTSSFFTAATSSFWAPSENSLFHGTVQPGLGAASKVTVHGAGGKAITANQDVLLDARGSPACALAIGTAGGTAVGVGSNGARGAGMRHSWRDIYVVPPNAAPKLQIAKAQGVHLASPPPGAQLAPAVADTAAWPFFGFDAIPLLSQPGHMATHTAAAAAAAPAPSQPIAKGAAPAPPQRILVYSIDAQTTPGLHKAAVDVAVGSEGAQPVRVPRGAACDGAVQTTPGLAAGAFTAHPSAPVDFTFAALCPLQASSSGGTTSPVARVFGGSEGATANHTPGAGGMAVGGSSLGAERAAREQSMDEQEGPGKARKQRGRAWRAALTDSAEKEVRRRAAALAVRVSPYFRRGAAGVRNTTAASTASSSNSGFGSGVYKDV